MDGIIFDLDGTLWDSTEAVAAAWNAALEENTTIEKRVTGEELRSLFGKPLNEIFQILFPMVEKADVKKMAKMLYEYQHGYLGAITSDTYPGVIEGIKELSKRMPLFLVSNCQSGYIEVFLKAFELEPYITDHTCPGDTGELKAHNIRLIMERNNLKNAVYVGDTAGDKKACDEACVPMIYAAYGFGEVENPAMTITSFDELLTIDYAQLSDDK